VSALRTGVVAIALGYYHSCVRLSTGAVRCWGSNAHGRLGDGTTTSRSTPVDVVGLGAPATAPSSTRTATLAYVGNVSRALARSVMARKRLRIAVAAGGSGSRARELNARSELLAVIALRRTLIATVRRWSVPTAARRANALLASALSVSLASDRDYLAWVDGRLAGRSAAAQSAFAAATSADRRASTLKRAFLTAYNVVRKSVGLTPLPLNYGF
jgi:hypothetical protein